MNNLAYNTFENDIIEAMEHDELFDSTEELEALEDRIQPKYGAYNPIRRIRRPAPRTRK
jgi:hypothetical protein